MKWLGEMTDFKWLGSKLTGFKWLGRLGIRSIIDQQDHYATGHYPEDNLYIYISYILRSIAFFKIYVQLKFLIIKLLCINKKSNTYTSNYRK